MNLLSIGDSSVLNPIWLSIKTAVTATVITFCLGVGAGYSVANYRGKAKNIIDGILTMPLVLPPTVVGLLLLLALGKNGLIGKFLGLFGLRVIFTWYATVIAATVVAFPLMYKTALAAFQQSQSNNLIACARTLGASETTIFWRIILPLAKPGLIAGTLLSFARALGEFGATLMLAGSIPGETQTIPIAIFFAAESGAIDRALWLVVILLAISLSAIAGVNYWQHRVAKPCRYPKRLPSGRARCVLKDTLKGLIVPICEAVSRRGTWSGDPTVSASFRTTGRPTQVREATSPLADLETPATECLTATYIASPLGQAYRPNLRANRRINDLKPFFHRTNRANKEPVFNLQVDIQKQLPEFLLDISFNINIEQNPLGILGASGAGKSTLLRCIAGLETPDRGKIVLGNKVLFDSAAGINLPPQQRKIGLVFQNYALFPHLTIAENIAFGMSTEQPSQMAHTVTKLLQQLNLSGMERYLPQQLSGGEQQRVALARAIASNPALTLLDEPFSALDTNLKTKIVPLFQEFFARYSGLSLYVTHNLREAYQSCPQLLLIDRGRTIACDTRQNIIDRPPNIQTAKITGYHNFSAVQKIAPQVIRALDWQCNLQLKQLIPDDIDQIGINDREVWFANSDRQVNTFPVWLTKYIEFPDRVTLYLKLHSPASDRQDYHLVSEITTFRWQQLQERALPWYVRLPAERILIFNKQDSSYDQTTDSD